MKKTGRYTVCQDASDWPNEKRLAFVDSKLQIWFYIPWGKEGKGTRRWKTIGVGGLGGQKALVRGHP